MHGPHSLVRFITSGPDAASAETIKSEMFTSDNIIEIKEAVRFMNSHPNLLLDKAYQRHLVATSCYAQVIEEEKTKAHVLDNDDPSTYKILVFGLLLPSL